MFSPLSAPYSSISCAPAAALFITTNPDSLKCSTSLCPVIFAITRHTGAAIHAQCLRVIGRGCRASGNLAEWPDGESEDRTRSFSDQATLRSEGGEKTARILHNVYKQL